MVRTLLLLLILVLPGYSESKFKQFFFDLDSNKVEYLFGWKYKFGDQPSRANIDYDDSDWEIFTNKTFNKEKKGIYWYRAYINLTGNQNDFDILALNFHSFASAYEVYWDGTFIQKNGRVAPVKSQEEPGAIIHTIKLNREQTKQGKHLIAIRLSNHHQKKTVQLFKIQFGYFSKIQTEITGYFFNLLFSAGIFLLAALLSFALFLGGGRHRSYLLFTIYCLTHVSFTIITISVRYININMLYLPYIDAYYYICAPIGGILLNLFFLYNFNIPRKYLHIALNVILTVLILMLFNHKYITLIQLYSIGLLLYSVRHKEPGSAVALLGVMVFTTLMTLFFYGIIFYIYFFGEIFFLFSVTLSISMQIKTQNRLHEESKLRFARLETELLKKNIKPHFLMNTLLSIMSWIEVNPKKAMKLIQSLADEFRMINEISSKKEIPIHEEIRLCETHLKLMGYRMDAKFKLVKSNIYENETVPPMIFHTLIENGLTHAYQTGENGTFKLNCEKNNNKIHYILQNDGSLLKKMSPKSGNEIRKGMGMKYVKARLQETYPDRWQMSYGLNSNYWEVSIDIEK